MMFGRLRTRGGVPLDDRGMPQGFKPERDPSGRRWLLSVLSVLGLVWGMILVTVFLPGAAAELISLRSVIILIVLFALAILLERIRFSRLAAVSEHLTALRMCGACGGDLRTADVHPDGCVACPECGAAWRHDRFGAADVAAHDPAALRSLIKNGYLAKRGRITTDKLGKHLEVALNTPLHWLGKGRAPADVEDRFLKYYPKRIVGTIMSAGLAVYILGVVSLLLGFTLVEFVPHRIVFPSGLMLLVVIHWFAFMLSGYFLLRMPIVKCLPGSNAGGQTLAEGSAAANE